MKKIIYEDKVKTKVIVPEVPAVVERTIVKVPRTVWDCDYCEKKSGDRMAECFGCSKTACDWGCREKQLEEFNFSVGYPGCYDEPAFDDYRFEYFYLCKTCRENPPEKIKILMEYYRNLEDIWKEEKELTNIILDEIERIKK